MIMRKLTRGMWNELKCAEEYAKCAIALKLEHPDVSDIYKALAMDEMKHSKKFYDHSMKLAEKEKVKNDTTMEIPHWMIENWEEELKDYLQKTAEVQYMIDHI